MFEWVADESKGAAAHRVVVKAYALRVNAARPGAGIATAPVQTGEVERTVGVRQTFWSALRVVEAVGSAAGVAHRRLATVHVAFCAWVARRRSARLGCIALNAEHSCK